jgi:hypothetical protein
MMNHTRFFRILGTVGLLLLSAGAVAQDEKQTEVNQLELGLQLMSRGEIRNGGMTSDPDNLSSEDQSAFILDRERLVVGYQRDFLEAKATLQHVGTWGQESSPNVSVYEAWAKLTAKNGLFAQLGRLALRYDDERIIGPDDWSVAALTHDALRLSYEGHGHKVHAILAYNQNMRVLEESGSYYVPGSRPYKTMHTLWYHYDVHKFPLSASLLFMNIGMQGGVVGGIGDNAPRTEYQQLLGGYLKFAPKHFSVEGSYYRQMGKQEEGMDIKAWMASGKVSWQPKDIYSVEAGYDYLSGDDHFAVPRPGQMGITRHTEMCGFSPVYGSHHKFYGAMDFFYISTYVNGFSPGLQNLYGGVNFSPLKNLSLTGRYHYMAITADLNNIDKTLGHVIELEGSYQLARDISLSAGFSYMTGTETMERLKRASGDGSLRWAWLSLNITPRLFTTKW